MQWKALSNPAGREKVAQGPPEPAVSNFLEPDFSAARSCLCTEQPNSFVSLEGPGTATVAAWQTA